VKDEKPTLDYQDLSKQKKKLPAWERAAIFVFAIVMILMGAWQIFVWVGKYKSIYR
jgi:hypothetical protein